MPIFSVTADRLRTRELTGYERGYFLANWYPLSDPDPVDISMIRGYTAADVQSYESPEELRGTIEAMLTAFDHPVLTRAQVDAINRPKADAS